MTALFALSFAAWAFVAAYMASGAWAVVRGRPRHGDPMRHACFATAVIFMCGTARWIFVPESMGALAGVLVLCIADAWYIWWLGRAYGRGEAVNG